MMLEFKQSDTSANIILTLTELVTISAPYFLFVFTCKGSKDVVSFVLNSTADTSLYPTRYNSFTINPSVLFAGYPVGQWRYTVYQQSSSSNTDPTLAQGAIEYGQMILDRTTDFAYTPYTAATSYKAYGG